jgi:DNA-directed RNA polymerase specialized sigma24 family protein
MQVQSEQNKAMCPEYATTADFCEVFDRNAKPLYLLAFLLTANHQVAERCFVAIVEESFEQDAVFKQWVHAWIKRGIIKRAIRNTFSEPIRGREKADVWCEGQSGSQLVEIDRVARLSPLERFVFVLSTLEGYSVRKCSVLLNCTVERVLQARVAASRQLSLPSPLDLSAIGRVPSSLAQTAFPAA